MAPIGSVIKNTIIYIIVMAITMYVSVIFFLFNGLVALMDYTSLSEVARLTTEGAEIGSEALTGIFLGLLTIFIGLGIAINLSLPSIVGDEMIEF